MVADQKYKNGDVVRVVQITDTHLNKDADEVMLGIDTRESFADVVKLIRQQQTQIDCLLCTGDISQDASVAAYQHFDEVISGFSAPHFWLCGNHDRLANIEKAVGQNNACLSKVFIIDKWQIILLNSSVKDEVHGYLDCCELAFLEGALAQAEAAGRNVLICVHHNPVPVQAEWLQTISLQNSEEFFEVIDEFKQVKGVIFGHVHQDLEVERKGVLLMATPSTCVQFHPDNDQFTLDHANPGYRWLELSPEGNIKTGVQRVEGKSYNVDFACAGY